VVGSSSKARAVSCATRASDVWTLIPLVVVVDCEWCQRKNPEMSERAPHPMQRHLEIQLALANSERHNSINVNLFSEWSSVDAQKLPGRDELTVSLPSVTAHFLLSVWTNCWY